MSISFEWNEEGFDEAVRNAVAEAAKEEEQSLQSIVDGVYETHAHKPVEVVESRLREATSSHDWDPDVGLLHDMASDISRGERVIIHLQLPDEMKG